MRVPGADGVCFICGALLDPAQASIKWVFHTHMGADGIEWVRGRLGDLRAKGTRDRGPWPLSGLGLGS